MKCLVTYSGSTWVPVNHRARFEVQAPQVRESGLPSAAVKITNGLSSAPALRRASVTLVSPGVLRHGLSSRCGLMGATRPPDAGSRNLRDGVGTCVGRTAQDQQDRKEAFRNHEPALLVSADPFLDRRGVVRWGFSITIERKDYRGEARAGDGEPLHPPLSVPPTPA